MTSLHFWFQVQLIVWSLANYQHGMQQSPVVIQWIVHSPLTSKQRGSVYVELRAAGVFTNNNIVYSTDITSERHAAPASASYRVTACVTSPAYVPANV